MSDFFPLIVDASGTPAIKEIPSGDVLDLTGVTVKAVSVDTTLAVAGASTLTGNTTIGGTLGVTGAITGSLTGNASTATSAATLTTARTIGGTSFDGSANIAVALSTEATTLATPRTIGGVSFDGSANITPTTFATASFSGVVTAATSAKITQVAITSSSNAVAWDSAAAANAYHVTTENTTFAAPSNAVEGAIISVELAQGGTPRTIAWNTVFEFAASTAPTVTATASKTDIFSFRYNGSVWQEIGRVQNLAQT